MTPHEEKAVRSKIFTNRASKSGNYDEINTSIAIRRAAYAHSSLKGESHQSLKAEVPHNQFFQLIMVLKCSRVWNMNHESLFGLRQ